MASLITIRSPSQVLELDLDKCNGYGNCVFAAPDLFELDLASNVPVFRKEQWSDQELPAAAAAVADCPARALRLYQRRG
jgi:ferredoxin